MSIPSMIVFEELILQGFAAKPKRNAFGELVIGYGHSLVNSREFIACRKKEVDGKWIIFNQHEQEKEILKKNFYISKEKAKELLKQDIMSHYEELSAHCLAFRRLRNACVHVVLNSQSSLGKYYHDLLNASKEYSEPKKMCKNKINFRNNVESKNNKRNKKSKNFFYNQENSYSLESRFSLGEMALVRLDVLVYLVHCIGFKRFMSMKDVLENICSNNFVDASSYMLGYSWGSVLKEKAVICAKRMKYGRIIRDALLDIPKEQEHSFVQNLNDEIDEDYEDYNGYEEVGSELKEEWGANFEESCSDIDSDIQDNLTHHHAHSIEKQNLILIRKHLEYA